MYEKAPAGSRSSGDRRAAIDSEWKHEPLVVVGVLSDQIDSARRVKQTGSFAVSPSIGLDEFVISHGASTICGMRSRSSAAFTSGSVSLMKTPAPVSLPARYLSLWAERMGG